MKTTFVAWWGSLSSPQKDRVTVELSTKCNAALTTVRAWGGGYRKPKPRSQELIVDYLKTKNLDVNISILFPY